MNLYIRYFSNECVVSTVDEAMAFLATIQEIKTDNNTANRINTFVNSSNHYPFRLKVSYSNYVLFLKTEAATLEQFKEEEKKRNEQKSADPAFQPMSERKKQIMEALQQPNAGWYDASMLFKRVILIPQTQKFQYFDTRLRVRCKATSALHCYDRMIEYLKSRDDIDSRSQFPSAKSQNFDYTYLGETV